MSELKATPGPWVADLHRTTDYAGRTHAMIHAGAKGVVPLGAVVLAAEGCSQEEGRANAFLIAAAPDGYALAEDAADFLLATFGQVGDECNREGWSDDDAFELYCKLTRFLARARGEP